MNNTFDLSSNRSNLHSGQIWLGALTLFLFSCGGGGTPPTQTDPPMMNKMPVTLSFAEGVVEGRVTRNVDDDPFTITATGSAGTGAITYTSSNLAVATVDSATGEVTILTVGQTIITATQAADDRFNAASVSYTLTVEAAPSLPIIPATQSEAVFHALPLTEAIVIENTGAPIAEDGCQFVDAADSQTTTTDTAGLSIAVSGANCQITGTPQRSDQTTAGTPEVIMLFIRAFNSDGSDWTTLALTITEPVIDLNDQAESLELTTDVLAEPVTFVNSGNFNVADDGCQISPVIPAGLTLAPTSNNQSCRITGTPTETMASTTFTITASNGRIVDPTPVQLTLAVRLPAMQIQTGDNHSCLLNPTGEIWCWGENDSGKLGTGDNLDHNRPTRVGGESNWRSLSAGDNHTCAINASAQLYCWGDGDEGRLGAGDSDDRSAPTQVMGEYTDWYSVSAGEKHTCGIRKNDAEQTLWCWGDGGSGRLGIGDSDERNTPAQVVGMMGTTEMYTDWHSVGAGRLHTCGIRKNGAEQTLWCWGASGFGRLGAGNTNDRSAPTPVMGEYTDWHSVSAGGIHTCGIRMEGANQTLWCWGNGGSGQLGTGNTDSQNTPTPVGDKTDWHNVSAGDFYTCGIRMNDADRTLWCWGEGDEGQLGLGSSILVNIPTKVGSQTDWHNVSVGDVHSCGIRDDGADQTLWCWGLGDSGLLGAGINDNQTTPAQVDSNMDWQSIGVGTSHTCGIRESAADQTTLWCWGYNGQGRLGTGNSDNRNTPTPVVGMMGATEIYTDWSSVSAGNAHTCGIRESAADQTTLWCWGEGDSGRLGTGNSDEQSKPVKVGIEDDWRSVSAGSAHTCGIRESAADQTTLWCWGEGDSGRLGTGNSDEQSDPTQVAGMVGASEMYTDWHSVSAGREHTCGIRESAADQTTLWCWGEGGSGRLGIGDSDDRSKPVKVGNEDDWRSISVGNAHTCGIRESAADQTTLWCWGSGGSGRLGIGNSDDRNTPTQVMGEYTDWQSVSAGRIHTCGTRNDDADQTLWCWGAGSSGRLGAGFFTESVTPRPVRGITAPSLVDLGEEHTCAIASTDSNNSLFCWGDISDGRLGIGDVSEFADTPQQTLFAIESLVTPTTLADALDTSAISFNLSGNHSWVTQTEQTNDNTDAAAVTTAAENDLACITSSISNAGSLSFYWRVSSEMDSDILKFYLSNAEIHSISGMVDWAQVDVPGILAGDELRWCYEKDDNGMTAGEDSAFLDQVVFTPTTPPVAP